jgi:hypothetical protein
MSWSGEYCDTNVSASINYEYRIETLITNYTCNFQTETPYWQYQYINAGTLLPLRDQRGKVILLVESGLAAVLTNELTQLTNDIIGDGYQVYQHNIAAVDVTAGATWFTAVTNTKALIMADYNTATNTPWTIFIVGHVPVPYSGLSSPGSHTENFGAHASDWYYADIDESLWTDTTVSNTTANYSWTRNIPGDGKLDPSYMPSAAELLVGRVDLVNMPAFGNTEAQRVSQYLNRNHSWRHKQFTVRDRSLIITNADPWDSFNTWSSFYGNTTNYDLGRWLTDATNSTTSYMFASSKGSGDFTEDDQIGKTVNFATNQLYVAFTTMYGSYYGDWDSAMITNCVLLAPICTTGRVLNTYYHEFVMSPDYSSAGESTGFELYAIGANTFMSSGKQYTAWKQVTTNGTFAFIDRLHNYSSLMGDPTLRLRVVAPPTNVTVSVSGANRTISWTAASDTNIQGYHVYRAPTTNLNNFTRITTTNVPAGSFIDSGIGAGSYTYTVRTIKLEDSVNRSYYNASQGIYADSSSAAVNCPPGF